MLPKQIFTFAIGRTVSEIQLVRRDRSLHNNFKKKAFIRNPYTFVYR